jgi:hypothetical protein
MQHLVSNSGYGYLGEDGMRFSPFGCYYYALIDDYSGETVKEIVNPEITFYWNNNKNGRQCDDGMEHWNDELECTSPEMSVCKGIITNSLYSLYIVTTMSNSFAILYLLISISSFHACSLNNHHRRFTPDLCEKMTRKTAKQHKLIYFPLSFLYFMSSYIMLIGVSTCRK